MKLELDIDLLRNYAIHDEKRDNIPITQRKRILVNLRLKAGKV